MKRAIIVVTLLVSAFVNQGCKKQVQPQPQDFFVGNQLKIAQIIYDGNESVLKKKLSSINKDELNRPAKEEMTLLFWAISNSFDDKATPERLQIITDLIKAGADPLQPQPNMPGSPAESVMQADKGVWIKAMLDGGLSPNARDKINNQPIMFKSRYAKNTETLKTMLDYGADINIKNSLGQTLVMSAFISSSFAHVELLLERGANPNPVNVNNLSLLTVVKRQIKDSKEGTEYNNECKKILTLMIKNGVEDM